MAYSEAALLGADGKTIRAEHVVDFRGDIHEPKDISAAAAAGDCLVIASDEGARLQVLRRDGEGFRFRVHQDLPLDTRGGEADIEGIAAGGQHVYAIGSHAANRRMPDADDPYEANRGRLCQIEQQDTRRRVWRFGFDPACGSIGGVESTSLADAIAAQPVLRPFIGIPSKENGIDIEGLAVVGDTLVAGFRGPVLRENLVPVLRFRFDSPLESAAPAFVVLDGLGVRDLAALSRGFLVLAGPVNDADGPCRIYFWDGEDMLPGRRAAGSGGSVACLAQVVSPRGHGKPGKPEALVVLDETPDALRILLLWDGLKEGAGRVFVLPR